MTTEHSVRAGTAARLMAAHDEYKGAVSPHYDEVLHEVTERVRGAGSLGKADIGALVFWKRLRADTRWVPELMATPENDVRAVTAEAVDAARDSSLTVPDAAKAARSALSKLPGFNSGDALASALLLAAAPERMAVYDRRAHAGLRALDLELSDSRGRYGRYMGIVEDLRAQVSRETTGQPWLARDVDVALYQLGGSIKK